MTTKKNSLKQTFLLICFIGNIALTNAQNQPQLDGVPNVEQVIQYIKAKTPTETIAKQYAAMSILWAMIALQKLDTYHSTDTDKEKNLKKGYNSAMGDLSRKFIENGGNQEDFKGIVQIQKQGLEKEIVENLFSDLAKQKYYENEKALVEKSKVNKENYEYEKQQKQQESEEQILKEKSISTKKYKKLFGVALMIIPFTIYAFWRGKRKFNRTNKSGVQEYDTYGKMVGSNSIETLAGVGAGILLLIGFLLLLGVI
jgi:hypothetical protein